MKNLQEYLKALMIASTYESVSNIITFEDDSNVMWEIRIENDGTIIAESDDVIKKLIPTITFESINEIKCSGN